MRKILQRAWPFVPHGTAGALSTTAVRQREYPDIRAAHSDVCLSLVPQATRSARQAPEELRFMMKQALQGMKQRYQTLMSVALSTGHFGNPSPSARTHAAHTAVTAP